MKKEMKETTQYVLSGFAAGVMTAASIWSLLIPETAGQTCQFQRLSFLLISFDLFSLLHIYSLSPDYYFIRYCFYYSFEEYC